MNKKVFSMSGPNKYAPFADWIEVRQQGRDRFSVRYGAQVDEGLTYADACAKLGEAIMHDATCEGKIT